MRGLTVVILVGVAACGGGPAIDSVDPALIAPHATVPIVIHGSGFVAQVRGQIDDNRPLALDESWLAQIGGLPAGAATLVDEHTLNATTPALEEGIYDVTVTAPDGQTATRHGALTVSAEMMRGDGGDFDGSTNDSSTNLDLSMSDLPPNDLSMPPMCNPPNIPATVGPGPNLSITLSNVKINNGSNFAHVAAGAPFKVSASYSLKDMPGNSDQILIGINPPNSPLDCLFNGMITSGAAVSGSGTVNLTAPSTPGTYTLRFHYGQAMDCSLANRMLWWSTNGAPTSAEDFAAICVP